MDNTIVVSFDKNVKRVVAPDIWQWDYGQILEIHGLELPMSVEVGFSINNNCGLTEDRLGITTDDVMRVSIPDVILENYGKMNAYIRVVSPEHGKTQYVVSANINHRPKPSGQHEEDPSRDYYFGKLIDEVTTSADRAESAADESEVSAKAAERYAIGVESIPESLTDNAKYYAQKSSQDVVLTNADRAEVERITNQIPSTVKTAQSNINATGQSQIERIKAESAEQVSSIKNAGDINVKTVNDAGGEQISKINHAGIGQVQSAKDAASQALAAAGNANAVANTILEKSNNGDFNGRDGKDGKDGVGIKGDPGASGFRVTPATVCDIYTDTADNCAIHIVYDDGIGEPPISYDPVTGAIKWTYERTW